MRPILLAATVIHHVPISGMTDAAEKDMAFTVTMPAPQIDDSEYISPGIPEMCISNRLFDLVMDTHVKRLAISMWSSPSGFVDSPGTTRNEKTLWIPSGLHSQGQSCWLGGGGYRQLTSTTRQVSVFRLMVRDTTAHCAGRWTVWPVNTYDLTSLSAIVTRRCKLAVVCG